MQCLFLPISPIQKADSLCQKCSDSEEHERLTNQKNHYVHEKEKSVLEKLEDYCNSFSTAMVVPDWVIYKEFGGLFSLQLRMEVLNPWYQAPGRASLLFHYVAEHHRARQSKFAGLGLIRSGEPTLGPTCSRPCFEILLTSDLGE